MPCARSRESSCFRRAPPSSTNVRSDTISVRPPSSPHSARHVKEVGLDSLVGGDGESCDVVLPCSERLDRALPAHLRIRRSLSKETIGGEIVDRHRNHESADVIAALAELARVEGSRSQDVVCQERFLDISACAEQLAGRGERLGDFGDDSGGPRIASFEPSEASR